MPVELIVPPMGESITEVQIGAWRKRPGDPIKRDESVVELESDKATVDLPAPVAGSITKVLKKEGERAAVGEVIGYMDEAAVVASAASSVPEAKPKAAAPAAPKPKSLEAPAPPVPAEAARIMPSARRIMAEQGVGVEAVTATGPGGRVLKEDVLRVAHVEVAKPPPQRVVEPERPAPHRGPRDEERVPMTPMRRRIAERLVEAQRTAALLTTFNEVDMSAVIAMREEYKAEFQEKYGVKLGFMSFFVKAVVEGLTQIPRVNAEIRHGDIVYHHYCDIGIAVGGGKGLVVPVLRNAEALSFAEIEKRIADFGARAKENKIALDELEGGTFTISNGGVYGSMMSTPIVNPPQSGILGLHAIQDRPVAREGQVVIRPMMYLALSYDHRLVDGREAVTFLRRVKEYVEKPARLLLDL
ncbi:MAG: 2-oxoglutarate dehydrogenase complex dihydrolipoyllysine-residue succinyltransferase [Candidatus Hydrogenedentes bacterium]|nr:2-oxoglutarate dehydrogenase complex dihydrolipoyllysine-residue succinyltransferase [Candidatus Hydrogenedentota bacterium]